MIRPASARPDWRRLADSRSRSCAARWGSQSPEASAGLGHPLSLPADGRPGRRDDPQRCVSAPVAVGVELLDDGRLGDHHDGNGTPRAGAVVAYPARKRRSESPTSGDPGMCGRMVPPWARNGPTGAPTGRWNGLRGRIYQARPHRG